MLTEIRPIRTEADHEAVVAEIWSLMEKEPEPGSPDGDRLEVLAMLAEAYEDKHYPVEPVDPIDAIEFMMEQRGLDRSDLEPALGHSGRVSEVLNRRRPLSISMIRALVGLLDIPADILVRPYPLSTGSVPEEEEGAVVYPFRKRQDVRQPGAANSNDRSLRGFAKRAAAAKRTTGTAAKKKTAAYKPAAKKSAATTAAKKPAARKSATGTSKRTRGGAAKRLSSPGSGRGSRPTGSRR
jgi:HTH-type transcriptional regulator / antitoxin HigA